MLIFAFRDQDGQWHGDPDAPLGGRKPARGSLTIRSAPEGGQYGSGRFAGQRREVMLANLSSGPGPGPCVLDGGRTFYPTREVHELLSAESPPARTVADERGHELTIEATGNGRLRVEVLGCDPN